MDIVDQLSQLLINDEDVNKTINSLHGAIFKARDDREVSRDVDNFITHKENNFTKTLIRLVFISGKDKIKFIKINIKDLVFGSLDVVKTANDPLWTLISIDRQVIINDRDYKHIELFENDIVQYVGFRGVYGVKQSKQDKMHYFRGIVKYGGYYFDTHFDDKNIYNHSILAPVGREKDTRTIVRGYNRDLRLIGNKYENENLLNEVYIREKS